MKLFRPRESHFQSLSSLVAQPARLAAIHADTKFPADLGKWLGRLKLLHGVPFNYLVPAEGMLPAESIRFFQVDFNWIYSLLEGAFSIGRSTSGDVAHDALFTRRMHVVSGVAARQVRPRRKRRRLLLRTERMEIEQIRAESFEAGIMRVETIEQDVQGSEVQRMEMDAAALDADRLVQGAVTEQVTGFFLRSAVVEGWPGLKVILYDMQGNPFKDEDVLRVDRISPSILLVMVKGMIGHVDLQEPAEGLHFGVDTGSGPCGGRSLRYITVPSTAPKNTHPGDQIDDASAGAVPCRAGRVLKISELAGNIQNKLLELNANKPGSFTSAEFALEMVEGGESVRFRNKGTVS